MVDSFLLAGMVLVASATVVGALRERERLKNLEAAWPHRERFAQILGELESAEDAPAHIVANLNRLYERILDERFLRDVASEGARSGATNDDALTDLKREFGDWHAQKIHDAVSAYAWVVMYSKIWIGFVLRRTRNQPGTRTSATRRAETAYLTSNVLTPHNDDPPNGGLHPA